MPFIGNQLDNVSYTKPEVDAKVQLQDEITELSDVVITAPADGEVLVTSGGNVINNTLAEAGIATFAQGALADSALQSETSHADVLVDGDIGGSVLGDIVQDTTPQLGGALDTNDNTIDGSSYRQIADGTLGTGTHTFNYANGDMQQLTATGSITLAFSNFVAGQVCTMIFDAINFGAHTITHPGGMLFVAGTSPTYTAAGTDRLIVIKDKDDVYTLTVIGQDLL